MGVNDDYFNDLWQKKRLFRLENDLLKTKKFVYASFPIINKPTIYAADMRIFIYADTYARYLRHNCFNVLTGFGYNDLANSSFIETKKLKNKIELELEGLNKIREDIKKVGIGFDYEKEIKTNTLPYIKFIQEVFIYLYNNKKIEVVNRDYFYHPLSEKIYNSFMVNEEESFEIKNGEMVVLKIEKYLSRIAIAINRLDLEDKYKEMLIKALNPKEGITTRFYAEKNLFLDIFLSEPELMAGIDFIALNPRYIDVYKYALDDEIASINDYIQTPISKGVFSGMFFHNPLNNKEIPIIISYYFNEDIHLGIPDCYEIDYDYAKKMDLDITIVLEDDYLINSDFLSGLLRSDGKEKIIEAFCDEGIADRKIKYDLTEIIINSLDKFGVMIPLFINVNKDEIVAVNIENIPIYLSQKFKQVITNEELVNDDIKIFSGSLNSLFTSGLASIFLKYYDPKISLNFPFEENSSLLEVSLMNIFEEDIYKEVLMPIVFNEIFKDLLESDYLGEIKKVIVSPSAYDGDHLRINKENNNLVFISDVVNKYSADAYRLYMLNKWDISKEELFELDDIYPYHTFLSGIKKIYNCEFSDKDFLSESFSTLKDNINICFKEFDLKKASQLLMNYYKEYLINIPMTRIQAEEFLVMLGVFIPFLAEAIYQGQNQNQKSFLLYEPWP